MNLKRTSSWMIALAALVLMVNAASASSPAQTQLSSGDFLQVTYDKAQICYTLTKSANQIQNDFSVDSVYRDGEYCNATFYTNGAMPDFVFPYRNAILGVPDVQRVWTRGQRFTAANEGMILWLNRPSGWHMVGTPPVMKTGRLPDVAKLLTGSSSADCFGKFRDKMTGEKIITYGLGQNKGCGAISFVVPMGWFVNDEATSNLFAFRDSGSLVTSKGFKLIRARTLYHREMIRLNDELNFDGGPQKNAKMIHKIVGSMH